MPNYQPEVTGVIEQTEECLLGCILAQARLYHENVIDKVSKIIRPSDFRGCIETDKLDRWVWRARLYYGMLKCENPPSPVTLAHKMIELNIFHNLDASLMAHCEYEVGCSLDYMEYAHLVKDYSIKRQAKYYADKGDIAKLKQMPFMNTRRGFEI